MARPGKFECPPNFVEEVNHTGLCLEDLQSDDLELWLMQLPSNVQTADLQDNSFQFDGESHMDFSDGRTFKSTPFKFNSSEGIPYNLLVPSKSDGKLRFVNKSFEGYILINQDVEIPKIEHLGSHRRTLCKMPVYKPDQLKERFIPFGGIPSQKKRKIKTVEKENATSIKKSSSRDENGEKMKNGVEEANDTPTDENFIRKVKKSTKGKKRQLVLDENLRSSGVDVQKTAENEELKKKENSANDETRLMIKVEPADNVNDESPNPRISKKSKKERRKNTDEENFKNSCRNLQENCENEHSTLKEKDDGNKFMIKVEPDDTRNDEIAKPRKIKKSKREKKKLQQDEHENLEGICENLQENVENAHSEMSEERLAVVENSVVIKIEPVDNDDQENF